MKSAGIPTDFTSEHLRQILTQTALGIDLEGNQSSQGQIS